jgi:hypothetical protein
MKKIKGTHLKVAKYGDRLSNSINSGVQKMGLKKEVIKISDEILALLDVCDQFVLNPVKP